MQIDEELVARGLIAQVTNEEEIKKVVEEVQACDSTKACCKADAAACDSTKACCKEKKECDKACDKK